MVIQNRYDSISIPCSIDRILEVTKDYLTDPSLEEEPVVAARNECITHCFLEIIGMDESNLLPPPLQRALSVSPRPSQHSGQFSFVYQNTPFLSLPSREISSSSTPPSPPPVSDIVTITDKEFEQDLTRLLTFQEKQKINDTNLSPQTIQNFVTILHTTGGIAKLISTSSVAECANFPIYSLMGYVKKIPDALGRTITEAEVTTMCLLWQGVNQLILERETCISYLSSSILDSHPHVENIILRHPMTTALPKLESYSIFERPEYIKKFFKLTDYGLRLLQGKFIQDSISNSEQYFYIIHVPIGPIHLWSPLYERISTNFFRPIDLGKYTSFGASLQAMVIPSKTMINKYLEICYSTDAIPLISMLGTCSQEKIEQRKLKDECVLPIGMPQVKNTKFVGYDYAGRLGFSLYHIYLALCSSRTNKDYRRAVYQIIGRVLENQLSVQAQKVKGALIKGDLYQEKETFGHIFKKKLVPWTKSLKELVLKDMAALEDFWEEEFGITPDLLLVKERTVYDDIFKKLTPINKQEALQNLFLYYRRTARTDDRYAQERLGYLYCLVSKKEDKFQLAIQHFARAGTPSSLCNMSICYRAMNDSDKAFEFCQAAVQAGNPAAQAMIGEFHLKGIGIEKNEKEAFRLFKIAADTGNSYACYNLALLYRDGIGVSKNPKEAWNYFKQAADKDHVEAQLECGKIKYNNREYEDARHYILAAYHKENPEATKLLAIMYRDGKGCAQDITAARLICPKLFEKQAKEDKKKEDKRKKGEGPKKQKTVLFWQSASKSV